MRRSIAIGVQVLLSTLCSMPFSTTAQCFPDSSASWCSIDLGGSDLVWMHMVMESDPDTIILGQTYKRIDEYHRHSQFENEERVSRDYVRSTPDGKGYVMLLDSMQEYLAADVNAAVGDTVRDVLIKEDFGAQSSPSYFLWDVVVDSIRTLENNGVIVSRLFIHLAGFQPGPQSQVYFNFWQAGIGNSTGALFNSYVWTGFFELMCLRIQDTFVFNRNTALPYLPGVPCECSLLPVGIESRTNAQPMIGPNPSTGLFNFTTSQRVLEAIIFDPQGRRILRTNEQHFDLTGYAPGLYTAVVTTTHGSQTVRLVVLRE